MYILIEFKAILYHVPVANALVELLGKAVLLEECLAFSRCINISPEVNVLTRQVLEFESTFF